MSSVSSAIKRTVRESGPDMRLRVSKISRIAQDVVTVDLVDPAGLPLPTWEPGSHLELVLPSSLIRHYSLCGPLDKHALYRVAVLRVRDGRGGSQEIHDSVSEGSEVVVRGPRNHFELVPAPAYLLLAGGIGVTPLYSMAQALADRGADWQMIYGARDEASMSFREELSALGSDHVTFMDESISGRPDFAQMLDQAPVGAAVYCCGPEPMIRHVEGVFAGLRPDLTLHIERFGGGDIAVIQEGDGAFDIELALSGVTLHVPADRTALDVVREYVPDHPYSCLEGQCGSCEVAVLAGQIDHRDEVLSVEEKEENSAMMLCSSRAISAKIVINL